MLNISNPIFNAGSDTDTFNSVINTARNPVTIDNNPLSTFLTSSNPTDKPASIYSVVIGGNTDALDIFSELSERTGGKAYQSDDIVDSFSDVIADIKEDLDNPDPSQSTPEPTSVLGLLMLGLGKIFHKLKRANK